MKKVILDGKKMNEKSKVHPYLKHMLGMKEYKGNNLDALWDVLITYNKPIQVELLDKDELLASLGKYGESLIKTFEDAMQSNPHLMFRSKN